MKVLVDRINKEECIKFLKDRATENKSYHGVGVCIYKDPVENRNDAILVPYPRLAVNFKNSNLKRNKYMCCSGTDHKKLGRRNLKTFKFVYFPKNASIETMAKMTMEAYKLAIIQMECSSKYEIVDM